MQVLFREVASQSVPEEPIYMRVTSTEAVITAEDSKGNVGCLRSAITAD